MISGLKMDSPTNRCVTFRATLKSELDDFIEQEGLACAPTAAAFLAIVTSLVRYQEEGRPLFPDVYVCSDVRGVLQALPHVEHLKIGMGELSAETAARAIKECAPLAFNGWSIYIERTGEGCNYGIFSAGTLPTSITPDEALLEEAKSSPFLVAASKLSNECVEVRGAKGNRRCIFFSAAKSESASPRQNISDLVSLATTDAVDNEGQVRRFLQKILVDAIQTSHGTLIAVVANSQNELPTFLADAILLPNPLNIASRLADYVKQRDDIGHSRLINSATLLRGMVSSDGITVLRTDGCILAYRGFLSQTTVGGGGGARKRTYSALKSLVESNELLGAFYCSQDGASEFSGSQHV